MLSCSCKEHASAGVSHRYCADTGGEGPSTNTQEEREDFKTGDGGHVSNVDETSGRWGTCAGLVFTEPVAAGVVGGSNVLGGTRGPPADRYLSNSEGYGCRPSPDVESRASDNYCGASTTVAGGEGGAAALITV